MDILNFCNHVKKSFEVANISVKDFYFTINKSNDLVASTKVGEYGILIKKRKFLVLEIYENLLPHIKGNKSYKKVSTVSVENFGQLTNKLVSHFNK